MKDSIVVNAADIGTIRDADWNEVSLSAAKMIIKQQTEINELKQRIYDLTMKEIVSINLDSARLESMRLDANNCNLTLSAFIESLHDYMLEKTDEQIENSDTK